MSDHNAAEWLLDRHVANGRGESAAIRCQGRTWTYADLLGDVWRVQDHLTRAAVPRGHRVLLVMSDGPAFLAWFLGCLRAGVIAVPVSTMLTVGELTSIAMDAEPDLLVISEEYSDRVGPVTGAVHTLRNVVVIDSNSERSERPPQALLWSEVPEANDAGVERTQGDDPAFWLYSSGTTGVPKAVMHRHSNVKATFDSYASHVLKIGPDDRCLSVAKLFFAYGLGNSLTFPLGAGATSVLEPRRPTPEIVLGLVASERPTLFFASPGFVAAILDTDVPDDTFASVRATITAGEALPGDLQRRFSRRFGHPVLDGIGSTEALHIFISNTLLDQRPGSSGQVVPGYQARLLDERGVEIDQADSPGFLHVAGESIASGYWRRQDATATAFVDGWLRTGDVYTRSADGHWTFLGRDNDMIKAGGIWVSPAEVESVLVSHPDILEAAVVGTRSDDGLEEVVAVVVARTGRRVDPDDVDRHCRQHMAAFKRPRRLVVVESLPKTATGKVQRFALRDRMQAGPRHR